MKTHTPIRVAVGVIKSSDGEILIAKRSVSQHQGGLWEFPGGKIEENETACQALLRELKEEVALDCSQHEILPLVEQTFNYHDKSVELSVFVVTEKIEISIRNGYAFKSQAVGNEGQPIKWIELPRIHNYQFPEANQIIIKKLLE
jgi:8-oxo-dGTP diphosphatase